jgi:tetratricopeptide (TPR) repeat protein
LGNSLTGHSNDEAEYHFERAITIDPAYAEAHHGYGLVLILSRKYPQALNQLQEAIRLDPRNASALSDLGDLLAAQGRTADAADAYRRVLSLTNDPSIAGPAADALRQLGR